MPFEIQTRLQPQEVLQKVTSETVQGWYHWRAWWPAGRAGKGFHSRISGNTFEVRKLPGGLGFSMNSMVDNVRLKGSVTPAAGGSRIVADAHLTPWSSVRVWASLAIMIAVIAVTLTLDAADRRQTWLVAAVFGIAAAVSLGMGLVFKQSVEKQLREFAESLLADPRQR